MVFSPNWMTRKTPTVMAIGTDRDLGTTEEEMARFNSQTAPDGSGDSYDPMMQEVEVFECYIKADYDGDDWPEWRKVVR